MKAIDLRIEYMKNPLDIYFRHPRFFRNCKDGIKQTAYRIVAKADEQIVWYSGADIICKFLC